MQNLKDHCIIVDCDNDDETEEILQLLRRSTLALKSLSSQDCLRGHVTEHVILLTKIPSERLKRIFDVYVDKIVWVHSLIVGVETLLQQANRVAEDIPITNSRGVYSDILAEYCLTVALYFTKRIEKFLSNQNKRIWERFTIGKLSRETVGLLGYGSIGRATAHLFEAVGATVTAADKADVAKRMQRDPTCVRIYDVSDPPEFREFLSQCDYVICSLPSTPETTHICSWDFFTSMKPSGVFISIGRGQVVDEHALAKALTEGVIKGAALDVFEVEPLPTDSPLWSLKNCLISSHNAHFVEGWIKDSLELFYLNLEKFLNKSFPLMNMVNRSAGY